MQVHFPCSIASRSKLYLSTALPMPLCQMFVIFFPRLSSSLLASLLLSFHFPCSRKSLFLTVCQHTTSDWWVFTASCKTDVTLSPTTGRAWCACVYRCVCLHIFLYVLEILCQKVLCGIVSNFTTKWHCRCQVVAFAVSVCIGCRPLNERQ